MNNKLPTFQDLKSFFKDNLRFIITIFVTMMIIYGLAVSYAIYSDSQIKETEEISTITGQVKPTLTVEDYTKLNKKAVSFRFYVENEQGAVYSNARLLKSILLSEEVLAQLESKVAIISPIVTKATPEDMLNVKFDSTTNALVIEVGTGDYNNNLDIAQVIFEDVKAGNIPSFETRQVVILTKPQEVNQSAESAMVSTKVNVSDTNYTLISVIVAIVSVLAGVFASVIRLIFKKEVSDVFNASFSEKDLVLDLTQISSEKERVAAAQQAVNHPQGRKCILTEISLPEPISAELLSNNKQPDDQSENILITDSISNIPSNMEFDEIVIFLLKNTTTKEWYKSQRIQLANYRSDIKIILI